MKLPTTLAEFADMEEKINGPIRLRRVVEMPVIKPTPIRVIVKTEADTEKPNPDVEELKENQKPKSQLEKALEVISLSDQGDVNSSVNDAISKEADEKKPKKKETKPEQKKSKMKGWPNNPSELLSYNEIANPLKEILTKGYRLFRKDEVKEFDYDGYNIGKQELQNHPSPRARFLDAGLKHEKKFGYNLIDVVLNVMFLLGVEQGRRAERRDAKPMEDFLETLEAYRNKNKDQRIRIDELEVMLELKTDQPNLSEEDFASAVNEGVAARRKIRIEELKSELKLDPSKSSFTFKTPVRAKFKELEKLSRTLTKETCSPEQWNQILQTKGWTFEEWAKRCKKKIVQAIWC